MSQSASLLRELRDLQAEVRDITDRLADLAIRVESAEFEVVEEPATESRVEPAPVVNQGPLAGASGPAASGSTSTGYQEVDRSAVARETGQFFLRCLRGEPRGISGQGRIRLQKRIYVVVRDFAGLVSTHPVRVFSSFSSAKQIVADRASGEFGDSIWCGFASQWEAKVATAEAGFAWPASVSN